MIDKLLGPVVSQVDVPNVGKVRVRELTVRQVFYLRELTDDHDRARQLAAFLLCNEDGEAVLDAEKADDLPMSTLDAIAAWWTRQRANVEGNSQSA